jgi:hypothetical protein
MHKYLPPVDVEVSQHVVSKAPILNYMIMFIIEIDHQFIESVCSVCVCMCLYAWVSQSSLIMHYSDDNVLVPADNMLVTARSPQYSVCLIPAPCAGMVRA